MPDDTTTGAIDLAESEGVPVYSADHQLLGTVKELRGGFFKVNAAHAHDYWLSDEDVALASGNQVILSCTAEEAAGRRRTEPATGHADPSTEPRLA